MTPFQFSVLLHYYVSQAPHPACRDNAPIWPETREWFISEGLLEDRAGNYVSTERCKVFLEHALNTPLPVQKWVVPR